MNKIYSIEALRADGKTETLESLHGKVVLIVNTASDWGLTAQLGELQKIYEEYKDQNFEILAFPCNQFGKQEPLEGDAIQEWYYEHYGVTYPILAKIDVNGDDAAPTYKFFKESEDKVIAEDIQWNFTKFLLDREGNVHKRYEPKTEPADMKEDIRALLEQDAE